MKEFWQYGQIYMSDAEIQFRLKRMGGEITEDNVIALAELNNCRIEEMWDKLNAEPEAKPLLPIFDKCLVLALYRQRYTDVAIAESTGYNITQIRLWRVNNSLPPIARVR